MNRTQNPPAQDSAQTRGITQAQAAVPTAAARITGVSGNGMPASLPMAAASPVTGTAPASPPATGVPGTHRSAVHGVPPPREPARDRRRERRRARIRRLDIEPGRRVFPGLEQVRALAETDIYAAMRLSANMSRNCPHV